MAIKTHAPSSIRDPDEEAFEGLPRSSASLDEAKKAFEQDDARRQAALDNSPVIKFLEAHAQAQTPDEQTVCGVHTVKVTLGDLKALVELIR